MRTIRQRTIFAYFFGDLWHEKIMHHRLVNAWLIELPAMQREAEFQANET